MSGEWRIHGSAPGTPTQRLSRRRLLGAAGTAMTAGLAGCSVVTSQEFAAAPVGLPEDVSEVLRLPEVFADSRTRTYERTVGDQDVEVTITNQFTGYQRTPPSMDSGWWVKASPSLVERFMGFDPRSGSGSAINVVASDLGVDEVHPDFVEGDTPVAGGKVTWVVPSGPDTTGAWTWTTYWRCTTPRRSGSTN